MRKPWRIATKSLCVAFLMGAVVCYASYRVDAAYLRRAARRVTAGVDQPSARVLALLHWVWQNHGSAHNDRYFIIRAWRATPVQIMEGGGDCADKSRLLTALLVEVGIPATMALCFDEKTGTPAHTIVEASVEHGAYMAVDPAYNLYFPRADGGGYHGLLDLRSDRTIVDRRVEQLLSVLPDVNAHSTYYMRSSAAYHSASTFNWGKNALTRLVATQGFDWWGDGMFRFRRPRVLEEPKLAASGASLVGGVVCLMAIGGGRWFDRRMRSGGWERFDNERSAENAERTAVRPAEC